MPSSQWWRGFAPATHVGRLRLTYQPTPMKCCPPTSKLPTCSRSICTGIAPDKDDGGTVRIKREYNVIVAATALGFADNTQGSASVPPRTATVTTRSLFSVSGSPSSDKGSSLTTPAPPRRLAKLQVLLDGVKSTVTSNVVPSSAASLCRITCPSLSAMYGRRATAALIASKNTMGWPADQVLFPSSEIASLAGPATEIAGIRHATAVAFNLRAVGNS